MHGGDRVLMRLHSIPLQHQMASSVASVTNVSLPADTRAINPIIDPAIDPTTSLRMGSITYDWNKNCYNLEWESRDDFDRWLTNEQDTHGIEICISKVQHGKQLYLSSETFHCTHNKTEGVKHYEKKTAWERKIKSKQIEGGCPCYVQIKTYPHTGTVLGKYEDKHSHETGKDNLKYLRIRVSTWELIEDWVQYGVTNEEIVSDPLCDNSRSD